jgi:hypothetical protein
VPEAPRGTTAYRVLTACGSQRIALTDAGFAVWLERSCTAEPDLTLVVEALAGDDTALAFLAAMHLPFASGDEVAVTLDGPWRSDFASFAVTLDPGSAPGPFALSYQLGHKSEVLVAFSDEGRSGFLSAQSPVTVDARFPNIEHGHVGWRLATSHLGADGGRGERSYTELGAYLPGADGLRLAEDLLPRAWEARAEAPTDAGRRVSWAHEPGLAETSDAVLTEIVIGRRISWKLIGRPSQEGGLALPEVRALAGAEALAASDAGDLARVEWFDWATVDGFDAWVTACTGVDLATCVRGLAETVTRTSSVRTGVAGE